MASRKTAPSREQVKHEGAGRVSSQVTVLGCINLLLMAMKQSTSALRALVDVGRKLIDLFLIKNRPYLPCSSSITKSLVSKIYGPVDNDEG